MTSPTCRATELSLGALALGALDDADRAVVERHVSTCADCAATLAELREVTALMQLVPSDAAESAAGGTPLAPPAGSPVPLTEVERHEQPPSSDLDQQRRRRLRRRGGALAVAAAAAVTAVALLASPWSDGSAPADRSVSMRTVDPQTHVHASVTLRPVDVGTQLNMNISGVPPQQKCQLVVVAADGHRSVAASWLATYSGTARVTGTTNLSRTQIARLDVSTPSGRVLVSLPVQG